MKMERIPLLSPSPGTQRFLQVYRLGPENAEQKVYIQAGLHADEWPGLLIIQHLLPKLEQLEAANQLKAQFVIVPFANPVGMDQQLYGNTTGRLYNDTGQNFNRGMALPINDLVEKVTPLLTDSESQNTQLIREAMLAMVWQAPDLNELQFLQKTLLSLSIDSDVMLDLHCDQHALPHIYCAGSQVDEASKLAQALAFPVVMHEDILGDVAFDGTHTQPWAALRANFPEKPISMACFSATLEFRGKNDVDDAQAKQDALNIVQYLANKQIVTSTKSALETHDLPHCFPIDQIQVVPSPCSGILVYHKTLGSWLEPGEIFAEVVLLDSEEPNSRTPIKCVFGGYLFVQTHVSLVRPGTTIAMIGCDKKTGKNGYQLSF